MKSIKLIIHFTLLILAINLIFAQSLTLKEQEVGINIALIGIGLEESLVTVTNDEVTIDYIVPELNSEDDIILQLHSIFIIAAKFSPDTTYTIIKVRYNEETDPILIAQVPTDFTTMHTNQYLDFESYWSLIELNNPDLVKEVITNEGEKQNNNNYNEILWFLLGFILIIIIILFIKNKTKTPKKKKESNKSKKENTKHLELKNNNKKIIAIILNMFFLGTGYLILGKKYLTKGIIFLLAIILLPALLSNIGTIITIGLWIYALIDIIRNE